MCITLSDKSAEGNARHSHAPSSLCDPHHTVQIPATRIGGHAYRYLAEGDRIGRVVSVFRHGFNIVFDEANDPTWLAVQTLAVPLHPWAIEVPAVPVDICRSLCVSSDGRRIALGVSDLMIQEALVDELRIAPYTPDGAERALSRLPLVEEALEEEASRRPADPFRAQIDAILERWRTPSDPAVLMSLLGLGGGSTPAGDDILVGMLAGLSAVSRVSASTDRVLQALRSDLEGVRLRTRPASRQMLAAAADDSFPEPLVVLVAAANKESTEGLGDAVACVLALGASSGVDLLTGFALGIECIRAGGSLSCRARVWRDCLPDGRCLACSDTSPLREHGRAPRRTSPGAS